MLQLRESKIEHFRIATSCDKDISELDITMYDPACMGRSKSVRDLNGPFQQVRQTNGAAGADSAQVAPFKQLHNNEWPALVVVDFEDCADVGMIQRRGRPGFQLKAALSLPVCRILAGNELDGHFASQSLVLGGVDLT